MRSLFETEVAQVIEDMGLDYKYDTLLTWGYNQSLSPDFSLNFPEYNRCGFVEAMGALSNLNYLNDNTGKYSKYINHGIYPNRDLVMIPGDSNYRPDQASIKRMIGVMLDSMAKQYVLRRDLPQTR